MVPPCAAQLSRFFAIMLRHFVVAIFISAPAASPALGQMPAISGVDSTTILHEARRALKTYAGSQEVEDWRRMSNVLREASRQLPGDDWVIGQSVAFALLVGGVDAATEILLDCQGTPWRCAELAGFVHHAAGRVDEASLAFSRADLTMPEQDRCWRQDITDLLDDTTRPVYAALGCQGRERIERRFWWFTQPLFMRPVNDRWVEHRARFVGRDLAGQHILAVNGREFFHVYRGILRYSWPAHWEGASHLSALPLPVAIDATEHRKLPAAWHLYSWEKPQSIPSAPGYGFAPPFSIMTSLRSVTASDWWAGEHHESYDPPYGPFYPLDYQVAFFRRAGRARVVAATNLEGHPLGRVEQRVAAIFVAPDERHAPVRLVDPSAAPLLRFSLLTDPAPQLVSIELLSLEMGAARARFAAAAPSATPMGLAVSDLLLFSWEDSVPAVLDSAYVRMLGAGHVRANEPVGIYWEIYGVPEGQEVRVTVSVKGRDSSGSWLRRLGRALGIGSASEPLRFAWSAGAGEGEFLPRKLRLDLSRLEAGTHVIRIEAAVGGQEPAIAERIVDIVEGGASDAHSP